MKGTRRLVDLALQSPFAGRVRVFFISSVAALNSWKTDTVAPEEPLFSLEGSVGLGYGESKAVAERVRQPFILFYLSLT